MVDIVNIAAAIGLPDIALGPVSDVLAPLAADALDVLSAFGASPWGLYSGGSPIITADTVLDVGYNKAYSISGFPVEQGAFASYDSIEQPFEGRIRFVAGGSPAARQDLIDSVDSVVGDLNTYDLVTPDRIYINANVIREEYRRSNEEGGASILAIEVSVQEVRILSDDSAGSNTADPASADPVNGGVVQPATPTSGQTAAALPFFATGAAPPPTLQ